MQEDNELWIADACLGQGTPEWHKARLGHITSSCVESLIGKGRDKDSIFSETGKKYLYKLASERNLIDMYKDGSYWEEYLDRTNVSSKAMSWGTENEPVARAIYKQLYKDYEVNECGFIHCGYLNNLEIKMYGDSPDGVVTDGIKNIGCIEIKCPTPETWMSYNAKFKEGKSLKDIEPKYYWQCLSHIFVLGVEWCDFIFFDKMQKNGFQCVRIVKNDDDIKTMVDKINIANDFIDNLLAD